MDTNVIKEFFPGFQPYIKQLLLGDIGFSTGNVQIIDIRSSIHPRPNDSARTPMADRFTVMIPYAARYVKWEVVFNSMEPQTPPDISFSDDFLSDPNEDVLVQEVPSFFKWDYRNEKSLLQLLGELLVLYKKYQVELLKEWGNRPAVEYSTLSTDESLLNSASVEVQIGNGDSVKKTRGSVVANAVNFLIALDIDFSRIPPSCESNVNFGRDRALLHIMFQGTDGNRITPYLYLSPNLQTVLGKTYSAHIPPFPPNSSCFMDYVPQVTKMLQDRISAITSAYEKRKEYISTLLRVVPGNIEYDSVTYFTASFLIDHQDFHCLLRITLSDKFPGEKPSFIFQSVYHFVNGRPYEKPGYDFPYSPRWAPSEMVLRALSYSSKFIEDFQKESVEALQNQKENKS